MQSKHQNTPEKKAVEKEQIYENLFGLIKQEGAKAVDKYVPLLKEKSIDKILEVAERKKNSNNRVEQQDRDGVLNKFLADYINESRRLSSGGIGGTKYADSLLQEREENLHQEKLGQRGR